MSKAETGKQDCFHSSRREALAMLFSTTAATAGSGLAYAQAPAAASGKPVARDQPNLALVSRHIQWTDAETGGAYEYDQTICPEFLTRPDLVQLKRPGGTAR